MAGPSLVVGDIGIYYERVAVVLGFVTLAAGIATFASCRSFISLIRRYTGRNIMENRAYGSFYKYHGYYWWTFLIIMVVHVMPAVIHTELLPGPDDPDALAHWLIFGFALGTLLSVVMQVSSCRSFVGITGFFTGKNLVKSVAYRGFYRFHAYYWWVLLVAVAGHVTAAAIHTSFWPG